MMRNPVPAIVAPIRRAGALSLAAAALLALPLAVQAQSAQTQRQAAQIPTCSKPLGTLAVLEPDHNWWRSYDLGTPTAVIKVFVNKSRCFTLVDRGAGMAAMQAERELASGGDLRGGSNLGKGQVRAADYVMVPDMISNNRNAGGSNIGGLIGGLLGNSKVGALAGGLNLKRKTADVVLTLTDMRSSEQVAMTEGHSTKTDLGWSGSGAFFGGGLGLGGASGYSNTEIGQVITLAYLQAYTDMVAQLGGLPGNASAANVGQAVSMRQPGRLLASADGGAAVRDLNAGDMLYPTGTRQGAMWEVDDELGNRGWVSSNLFELAR
ncbi:CsgG/HfaB family protein [Lysobacter sp. A3-1-A15]|uniref:CsgG/HfaB family protein n=1 Tax=Novilysobacter viscosus TaxID=3098602 RepID=UPI002ED9E98B